MAWKDKIKDYFTTGKIPTQAQFAELIDKIPSTDSGLGGVIDETLDFFNPNNPNVNGYRFVNYNDKGTYIFISFYNASEAVNIPWIILHCETCSPAEYGQVVPVFYTILTSEQMQDMYLAIGNSIEKVQSNTLVDNIPSNVIWHRFGLQSGHTYSNSHVILEATDTYEKHWFDADINIGVVAEMCKPNINNPWIIYRAIQISNTSSGISTTEYVPNGYVVDADEYNVAVNTIRTSIDRPFNLNDFVRHYMKSK